MRHAFTSSGGSLGEPGSVAWIFEKKGELVVDASRHSEDDLLPAIEAGAEDVALDDDVFEIVTGPSEFTAVREALEERRGGASSPRSWPCGPAPARRSASTTPRP